MDNETLGKVSFADFADGTDVQLAATKRFEHRALFSSNSMAADVAPPNGHLRRLATQFLDLMEHQHLRIFLSSTETSARGPTKAQILE